MYSGGGGADAPLIVEFSAPVAAPAAAAALFDGTASPQLPFTARQYSSRSSGFFVAFFWITIGGSGPSAPNTACSARWHILRLSISIILHFLFKTRYCIISVCPCMAAIHSTLWPVADSSGTQGFASRSATILLTVVSAQNLASISHFNKGRLPPTAAQCTA